MSLLSSLAFPKFEELERVNRKYIRRILGLLIQYGSGLRYSELQELLGIPPKNKSTLSNNLDVLETLNFIARDKRGPIRLRFKTPLCFLARTPSARFAYLGLLGIKGEWTVSETETAIAILEDMGYRFEKVIVLTTQEAIGSWSGAISPKMRIEWHTMSGEDINKVDRVEERIEAKLVELMERYILIMDCTSGPRPAGIAYYRLASKYRIPLIYVYEPQKELVWLISKEDLEKELGHLFVLDS